MTIPIFLCDGCLHRSLDDRRCKAFPDGIPQRFYMGDHFHFEPVPGDRGIVFEPMNREWLVTAADIREALAEPPGEGEPMP